MKTGEEQQEAEPGLLPGRRGKRATKKAAWRIAQGYSGHLCWVLWGPVDSQLVSTLLVLSSDPPQHIVGQPCPYQEWTQTSWLSWSPQGDRLKEGVTEQRDDGKDRLWRQQGTALVGWNICQRPVMPWETDLGAAEGCGGLMG